MCEKVFRPDFEIIKSFEEFSQFYWYRDELILICKKLGLEHNGTKANLIMIIKEYFYGNKILRKKNSKKRKVNVDLDSITLETKLVDCGFSCSQKFREFFSKQVGGNFKFNTDVIATAKKVFEINDKDFSLGDLLDVYYGKKVYAKYDKSSCQWNKFYKDFCADSKNNDIPNKMEVASKIWKLVRESTLPKVYSSKLLKIYGLDI